MTCRAMYKDRILKLLRESKAGFLSGEELADKLGISRTMVWKHIKSLEREGFGIEAVPSRGYRITSAPDLLRTDDIKSGLKTKTIGKQILLLPEAASTNTLAMEMAAKDASEGTVVIAETQTAGKGRLGRKWISPKGNLYFSVILRPNIPIQAAPLITLVGAVAVVSAIRTICQLPAAIKWPNDVLLRDRKVAGLLTEMSAEPDRVRHIALGIGVNVNMDQTNLPANIAPLATTLGIEGGQEYNRNILLQQILRELDNRYELFPANSGEILKEWEAYNMTIGNRVAIGGPAETLEGLAQGVDGEGRLIIRLGDGALRTVAAGDVTILKKGTS